MSGINRRQFVTLSASALCSLGLVACGGNNDKKQGGSDSANGSVYFLNFKPEADQQWKDLAAKYKDMVDRDSAYEFLQRLQVETTNEVMNF